MNRSSSTLLASSPSGTLHAQPSTLHNPFLFHGRRLDPETNFYYFRNRYYDPRNGRFIQRDPVWDARNVGGWHTALGNAPASKGDPLGLEQGSGGFKRWAGRPLWPKPKGFARYTPKLGKPLWPYLPPPATRLDYEFEKHGPITVEMELRWGTVTLDDLDFRKYSKKKAEKLIKSGCATPDDFPHLLLGPRGTKRWEPAKRALMEKLDYWKKRFNEATENHVRARNHLREMSELVIKLKLEQPSLSDYGNVWDVPGGTAYSMFKRAYQRWSLKLKVAEHFASERAGMVILEADIKRSIGNTLREIESELKDVCKMQAQDGGGIRSGMLKSPLLDDEPEP